MPNPDARASSSIDATQLHLSQSITPSPANNHWREENNMPAFAMIPAGFSLDLLSWSVCSTDFVQLYHTAGHTSMTCMASQEEGTHGCVAGGTVQPSVSVTGGDLCTGTTRNDCDRFLKVKFNGPLTDLWQIC